MLTREPLKAVFGLAPLTSGPGSRLKAATPHFKSRSWSNLLSSFSWFRMYSRISFSSRPTVDTKYPRAQKWCPT